PGCDSVPAGAAQRAFLAFVVPSPFGERGQALSLRKNYQSTQVYPPFCKGGGGGIPAEHPDVFWIDWAGILRSIGCTGICPRWERGQDAYISSAAPKAARAISPEPAPISARFCLRLRI